MSDPRRYEIIEQSEVYRGFFRLSRYRLRHELFAGGFGEEIVRELFHRGSCVAVVLYDPTRDRVVLIEQFRIGALKARPESPWLIEIVAGAVEEGETPEQVAHREAEEEAGVKVRRMIQIGEFFTTPGGCSELISLFCGIVDSTDVGGIYGLAEEQEDIRVFTVSLDEAIAMIADGRVDSAIPIIGIQWLALNRGRFDFDA